MKEDEKLVYERIKEFLIDFHDLYHIKCNQWHNNKDFKELNLKKKRVLDIVRFEQQSSNNDGNKQVIKIIPKKDDILFLNITQYLMFLNDITIDEEVLILENLYRDLKITSRVKNRNSVIFKTFAYVTDFKKDFGRVSITKCFNDLYGSRIILDLSNIDENKIREYCKSISGKLKCINANKGDYKAIHIYFAINNFFYPWELQIWLKKYEKSNKISHKNYKQIYTNWEKE